MQRGAPYHTKPKISAGSWWIQIHNPQCNAVTNTKCSSCSPELETVTQSFSEECGEEHHSLGIQNPAIDQKSLHVCAEVLMCIAAACVYYCVIGFVSRQGTQCSLKSYCRFLCYQEQINDRTCTDSTPYCAHLDGLSGPSG
jgi:hypothetical protein